MEIPKDYRQIEGSQRLPARGAHLASPADPSETFTVTIRVRRQPGAPEPPDMDYWAKTPPGRRQFLSREQAAARYGASQADLDKVAAFAKSNGLKVVESSAARRSVVVSGTVAQMEKAFAVTLGRYESPTETYRGREGNIYLPGDLADIVEGVLGLDNRKVVRHHGTATAVLPAGAPAGASALTPVQVATLYNFPSGQTAVGQTVGILEFGGGYTASDIQSYCKNLSLKTPTLADVSVDQATNKPEGDVNNVWDKDDDFEVALDIEVVAAIAQDAKIAIYFAPNSEQGIADAISSAISDATNAPQVLSVSWAGTESGFTASGMKNISAALAEAATVGVTVLVSSGDGGSDCGVGDGNAHVEYPASDPWVTACGGTIITNVKGTIFTEDTWNDDCGATGGGISDVFDGPSWQANIGLPKSANDGKHEGRGVPDVSGNASPYSGYDLYIYGKNTKDLKKTSGLDKGNFWGSEGGTSAVAPLYAGLVALINAHIGDSVGYLNPTLYSLAGTSVFRDINDGVNNKWSGGPSNTPSYTSGPGWDACTGLGVLDGTALQDELTTLLQKSCTLITDRSTFGKGEIDAMLQPPSGIAIINPAFYVMVDGFRPDELGITASSFVGTPNVAPKITLDPSVSGMKLVPVSLKAQEPLLPDGSPAPTAQRFTWTYEVIFTDDSGFPAVDQVKQVELTATMTNVSGAIPVSDTALIELVGNPNPYETDGPTSWLSTDLRVFQITPGQHLNGLPSVTMQNTGNAAGDASTFIKAVIDGFNKHSAANHPFDLISTDYVTAPLELSQMVDGEPVFNFAVARVRYQDAAQDALNVRVFFRLLPALQTSLAYDPTTNYRKGGQAGTAIPLLGITNGTLEAIPCFAEPRVDSSSVSLNTQTDPANVQTIKASTTEVDTYFGCWLDINQTTPQFPINPSPADGPWTSDRKTVQELVRNVHQCLVSEIAFDPDPIPNGATPANSDKLAQRNLNIVQSANPGDVASHRIPSTFQVKPTHTDPKKGQRPDELMFDWGNVPVGSLATIYLPALDAKNLADLATQWCGTPNFTIVDAHTLQCPAEGISYLPVPSGPGPGYVGLLDIGLPPTVTKGQVFNICVKQLTDASGLPPVGVVVAARPAVSATAEAASGFAWRRVVGTFQIRIPVTTKDAMVDTEERLLSNLLWIQKAIPEGDRWSSTFNRYINQIADRVDALGGDSSTIVASPSGPDVMLRLNVLDPQGNFFDGPVDIDIKHRTLESEPRQSFRRVLITKVFPVKNLRRFPQSDYVVTVTPSDWFHPESEFVTIPPSGVATLTFTFQHKAPGPVTPPSDDITLCLKIVTPQGQFFGAPVDLDIKHRTLESAPGCKLREVVASDLIQVKGLRRFPQSDYVVTVSPSSVFHPESEFVTIPASGAANLTFVIHK